MSKSKFVDFKAIKAAVSMEQVLDRYGLLDTFKRSGDSLSGPCPLHGGTNPTQFRVSLSKNVWNCFSECKHGGNVLDFVAEKDNLTVHAAALKLAEWFDLSLAEPPPEENEEPQRTAMPQRRAMPTALASTVSKEKFKPEESTPNAPLFMRWRSDRRPD